VLETAVIAAVIALLLLIGFAVRSSPRMAPRMYLLRITLGVLFFFLGIAGALLPVLQGWLFFLLSALMFFPNSRFAVKVLSKVEPKMPRLVAWLRRLGIGDRQVPTA
jgi:hypothetical protein